MSWTAHRDLAARKATLVKLVQTELQVRLVRRDQKATRAIPGRRAAQVPTDTALP